MIYKSLETESFEQIHHCFNEAFSDYIIRMELPFEKFHRNMVRNGVDLRFSMGLYDGDRLVGFILNGVGAWHGNLAVYDSGTGIIKEYRGKKYSKEMLRVLMEKLLENDFSQYLLEVIQTNKPAFTLYSNQGFTIKRELMCFRMDKEDLPVVAEPDLDFHCRKMDFLDWNILKGFWNSIPSWQNSIDAVERVSDQFKNIGVFSGSTCIGYGIFDPESGEIVHSAVRNDMRKRGVGSLLLHKISEETKGPHLRIINVDKNDEETVEFLQHNNFVNDVNQYEMILNLKSSIV
ncbi:MAG: GNAT family N-acetyltransferase [Theionarchaea archaeon]|nr:GNAT family N-acetyltransferase [Theionarchaea archaeon]